MGQDRQLAGGERHARVRPRGPLQTSTILPQQRTGPVQRVVPQGAGEVCQVPKDTADRGADEGHTARAQGQQIHQRPGECKLSLLSPKLLICVQLLSQ